VIPDVKKKREKLIFDNFVIYLRLCVAQSLKNIEKNSEANVEF